MVMRAWLSIVTLVALALALAQAQAQPVPAYRIIVHPSNPVTTLDRRYVEDVFLKKVKSWPGGDLVRPVDLEPSSPVRARFTGEVLRRPLAAVRAYWQQRIFSGRDVPPPELDSDDQVIAYVLRHAGAIGYVSGATALDRVKPITVR